MKLTTAAKALALLLLVGVSALLFARAAAPRPDAPPTTPPPRTEAASEQTANDEQSADAEQTTDAVRITDDDERTRCIQAATARAQARPRAGSNQQRAERIYQAELAACHDPRAGGASLFLVGATNVDYYRLARLLVARRLSAAEYLQRVRDRTRKVRAALRDPARIKDLARADRDGDLIPDARDRCPGTGDLMPTDDYGCPSKERPTKAPPTRDVLAILDKMHIAATPACQDAPVPSVAEPLRAGVDPANPNSFLMALTRVNNQPSGCRVMYETQFRLSGPQGSLPPFIFSQKVWSDSEGAVLPGPPMRMLFRRNLLDPPQNVGDEGGLILHFFNVYSVREWRVRAVNGGGLTSGWSRWQHEREVKF